MGVVDQSLGVVPYGSLLEILADREIRTYDATQGEVCIQVMRRAKEDRPPEEVLEVLASLDQEYGYVPASSPFHWQGGYTGKTFEEAVGKAEAYVAFMKEHFPRCQEDMWQLWLGELNKGLDLERMIPEHAARVNGGGQSGYVVIPRDEYEAQLRLLGVLSCIPQIEARLNKLEKHLESNE